MPEVWRPVPGWPYEASSRGQVRSLARGVPLKRRRRRRDGYLFVDLSDRGRRRQAHVAALVLEAFTGPRPPGAEACHRNGRRGDCRRANLYWGSKPQNRQERERHRRERAARRADADVVTEVNGRETGEIGKTACCLLETGTGVSPC